LNRIGDMKAVIVIRPHILQGSVLNKLKQNGFYPLDLPAASLTSCQFDDMESDIAIFISQPSVIFGPEHLNTKKLIAVGQKTGAVASKKYGYTAITPQQQSSQGLLELPDLKAPLDQRIVIYCGQHHQDRLEKKLSERGARVVIKTVYGLIPPNITPTYDVPQNGVIWATSFELLRMFKDYYIDKFQITCLKNYGILSSSVNQNQVQRLGFKGGFHPLDQPGEDTMIEELHRIDW